MSTRNVEDAYPLSPMQQGILFHSLYSPAAGLYVTQFACELHDVDVTAVRRAWQAIIDRYPPFRTAFVWKNVEKPLQVVGRRVELPFQCEDWRELSPRQQQERLDQHLEADRRQGFQLNKAPLLRVALFQVSDHSHQLVLSHHHITVDGWSMALVFKEAFALYAAYAEGRELHFAPSRSYRDYIEWLQQQDLSKAEEFWRETLQGFKTPTPLAIDRVSNDALEHEETYAEHQIKLSPEATVSLQTLARKHQLTLNTIVQGSWALLLSRYSGEQDVLFGSVIAGRPSALPGIETMVGLFINTLPVRVRVSPEMKLIAWLQDLQVQQSEARQFDYSPLVQVQGWSDVPRGVPLFRSIVAFQNFPFTASKESPGQKIGTLRAIETQNYPLALSASVGSELSFVLKYDSHLFDSSSISRLLSYLQTVLNAIAASATNRRLCQLPLLTEAEKRQLLREWNDTDTDYPRRCVHKLFEEQCNRTPDAVAVLFAEEEISYRELNRRANQLAHYLSSRGVGPEVPVGICVERSIEMIVGILGILKAGGAYVPFDTQNPMDRTAFMIEDAQVEVLLTQKRLLDILPQHTGQVTCLDTEWNSIAEQSTENPDIPVCNDNLAYILYTSGSTGQPKGVSVLHRGIVRLVKDTSYADFGSDQVFLQLAAFSFDASTFEIWGSLLNGGRLVIMPPHRPSLEEIGEAIRVHGVTTLWLTAGLFNLMVDERLVDLKSLRQLLAGGDVLSVAHVEKFLAAKSDCRLINGYGPTENTTFTCCHTVQAGRMRGSVPIGRVIANTLAYVLNDRMNTVPVGVQGELYIGGHGLARGYSGRPELTAEKFVPHPFSSEAGARLYRTGDLVRYFDDGSLEFVGRIDRQVKVRGFRIELAEIEAILNHHPAIRDAVVSMQTHEQGEKRLVAYLVSGQEAAPTAGELRLYLSTKLPDYMIPAQYVWLPEMPLTVNGKIDHDALPAPESQRPQLESEYCAARTPPEELLVRVWSEVLGVELIGIHDSFFELGGESILAIKLLYRINENFKIELPLRALFEQPTIAELASVVVQSQAERADQEELLRLLGELEDVSEGEARVMLTTP